MKDLDFDELDRAVNSLIGNKTEEPAVASTQSGPAVVNPGAPVVATPSAAPVPDLSVPAAPSQAEDTSGDTAQPLAARRSSGRFMDVVHPSSDMRSAAPLVPVSRVAADIQPSGSVASAPATAANPPAPTSEPAVPTTSEWPDPIDYHESKSESATVPPSAAVGPLSAITTDDDDSDISRIADSINDSLADSKSSPLESPFLSDTKVEKRPLGAFSNEAPAAEPAKEPESIKPVDTPVTPGTAETTTDGSQVAEAPESSSQKPVDVDTPLPAELHDDLLMIEADEDTTSQAKKDEFVPPAAPASETPIGPTSITQQYKEQPSTGDQPTGAIFDTEAYHAPLAHPKKKKSGWLMVLWIVLLLVLGAGVGAAVYFFVLPRL